MQTNAIAPSSASGRNALDLKHSTPFGRPRRAAYLTQQDSAAADSSSSPRHGRSVSSSRVLSKLRQSMGSSKRKDWH